MFFTSKLHQGDEILLCSLFFDTAYGKIKTLNINIKNSKIEKRDKYKQKLCTCLFWLCARYAL